jgi:hypothetical protein
MLGREAGEPLVFVEVEGVYMERLWHSLKYECVYPRLRDRIGTADRAAEVDWLLQCQASAQGPEAAVP